MYKRGDYLFRILEKKDIEWARLLHNDPEVLNMLTDTNFVNEYQQAAWFENLCLSSKSKRLVIELNKEKIGLIRLDEIDHINKSICVGLDIVRDYRGKGYGKNAFLLLLDYVFNELNMNRAWLLVAEFNERAYNLYKKIGFVEEGRQRERLYRFGKYYDYIMMSILKKEYK
jgi:RimJ/RimL family protein N-acetyltransferase